MKECYPIQFYADPDDLGVEGDAADAYPNGSMEDCVDYYTEAAEDALDAADDADCDFDEDKATECFAGGTCKDMAENIEDSEGEASCRRGRAAADSAASRITILFQFY